MRGAGGRGWKDALAKASAAARLAREQYGIQRAVLFGSLAVGASAEDSDLVLREDLSASGSDRDLLQEIETRGVELT